MYEIFERLLQQHGITAYKVSKETGITQSTLSDWKRGRSTPKTDNMKKIADYFGVSVDYLMTGEDSEKTKSDELTAHDRRDIGKDLDRIMEEIANDEDGPLFYNGKPLNNEDLTFLSRAIEAALTDAKKRNKVTYNPNKNKKQ